MAIIIVNICNHLFSQMFSDCRELSYKYGWPIFFVKFQPLSL